MHGQSAVSTRPKNYFYQLKIPSSLDCITTGKVVILFFFRFSLNKHVVIKYWKPMITVTENARQRAISLIKDENRPADTFIRVGVDSGGCSGLSYKLEFDNVLQANDKVFEDKGIKIVVDKKSFLYLIGTQLDYSAGLNGKGFVFINPNASRTCGCGESFSV